MSSNLLTLFFCKITLISQFQIVSGLSIVVAFFVILLLVGVRKSYLLKKENDQLNEMNDFQNEEEDKAYKDFTDGHMYDN